MKIFGILLVVVSVLCASELRAQDGNQLYGKLLAGAKVAGRCQAFLDAALYTEAIAVWPENYKALRLYLLVVAQDFSEKKDMSQEMVDEALLYCNRLVEDSDFIINTFTPEGD